MRCAKCDYSWIEQQPSPRHSQTQKDKDREELASMQLRPASVRRPSSKEPELLEDEEILAFEPADMEEQELQTLKEGQTDIFLKKITQWCGMLIGTFRSLPKKIFKYKKLLLITVAALIGVTLAGGAIFFAFTKYESSQGEAVIIKNIVAERRLIDDAMHLTVKATIENHAHKPQVLSPILIEALGDKGQSVEKWTIPPPQTVINHGKTMSFSSSILAPDDSIVEVSLSFTQPPHDE